MIDGLKPYPDYRDSGLPWLGTVPAHWEVRRLRSVSRLLVSNVDKHSHEDEVPVRLCNYTDVYRNDYVRPEMRFMSATASPEEVNRFRLCTDDVLITKDSENWQDIAVPALVMGEADDLICGYHLAILRPNPKVLCGGHLHRSLQSEPVSWQFRITANGVTRYGLSQGAIKEAAIPVPPLDEQAAIVRFLDHADRRIRRYVRAKRRLVALLNEQKQALIHQAVTRGLDPDVRLKPSGVEWLGNVPEHWTLKRFKFATRITSGQVDPRREKFREQILVAPNHIESGTGRIISEETANAQGADSGKYQVRAGQVIYSKIRPNLKKAAIATRDCLCSADMYPVTPSPADMTPGFLLLLLLSGPFTKYAVDCSMRVAMPKINRDALGECWLWFPSIEEQALVVSRLRDELQPYSDLVQRVIDEAILMQEYRTRLIADVVTGKLDVREAAGRLPDESDEGDGITDEPLDGDDPAEEGEPETDPEEAEA